MKTQAALLPLDDPSIGHLTSRIAMSAMTRSFASKDHLCTTEMAAYYARRAQAGIGLILTEGIIVHPSGDGYNTVPHLCKQQQASSWRQAVDAVQKYGTKIYAQLWHCGRISHPDYTDGFDVVSSTGRQAAGINRQNNKPYGAPRALSPNELPEIYDMFCHSAGLALSAGFDGVELHMGHGYLIDQFLDGNVNDRTDQYGGSVENRCRVAIELLQKVIGHVGADRVMVRISPSRMMGGLYEWPDMLEMLGVLLPAFESAGLRQLDISCANADYFQTSGKVIAQARPLWPHLIVGGASLSIVEANHEIEEGRLNVVTWGRSILANPDFAERVRSGMPLVAFNDSMRTTLI